MKWSVDALLAAVVLAACAPLAYAQQWRAIQCPPTRQDLAWLYRPGEVLDPLEGPGEWVPLRHDQSASAELGGAAGRADGSRALSVTYHFIGKQGLEYIDIARALEIPVGAQAVGLWMRSSRHSLPARVRLTDASGEFHQYSFGMTGAGTWTLGVAALTLPGEHWGGDGNGVLDPPLTIRSLVFDRPSTGFTGDGEVRLRDLRLYTPAEGGMTPHGIRVSVPADRKWLVYEPGEEVRIGVELDPAAGGPDGEISADLVDPYGDAHGHWALHLVGPGRTELSFVPPGPGAYDVRLRIPGDDDSASPWADFRLAVLPPIGPGGEDSPFGVGTHFCQGWSQDILELIARCGVGFYRDEIPWGAVETERGRRSVPGAFEAWVDRGASLRLSPLIVLDYGNRLYDNGGYPVSEEAVAGFAAYARAIATDLADRVHNVEVWNEWCGGCGMGNLRGEAKAYRPLLEATSSAVRAAAPNTRVVGVGGEGWGPGTSADEVGKMLGQGAGRRMDAFSIHPYRYPVLPDATFRDHLSGALDLVQEATGQRTPLWVTEIGWPTHVGYRGSSFLHQARCLVRAYAIAMATPGVEKLFWYDFKDDGTTIAYNENCFGLIHNDAYSLAPKPAYAALARLIEAVQGRKLVSGDLSPDGVWRIVFEGEGCRVTLLFTDGADATARVPLPAGAKVTGMFWQPVPVDGEVSVTQDPVYIEDGPHRGDRP
jgi:peptidoglycan/xylan/chitin deacetylase (PgdA/CDA1 family)